MRQQAGDSARQDAAADEAARARDAHTRAEEDMKAAQRTALMSAVVQARAQQLAEHDRQR